MREACTLTHLTEGALTMRVSSTKAEVQMAMSLLTWSAGGRNQRGGMGGTDGAAELHGESSGEAG